MKISVENNNFAVLSSKCYKLYIILRHYVQNKISKLCHLKRAFYLCKWPLGKKLKNKDLWEKI